MDRHGNKTRCHTGNEPMSSEQCPRFQRCNAAVCPLDKRLAMHLPNESVCYYLRASGKEGAGERFRDDPIFRACLERLPEISKRFPDIRRQVARAARKGFKGKNLRRKD